MGVVSGRSNLYVGYSNLENAEPMCRPYWDFQNNESAIQGISTLAMSYRPTSGLLEWVSVFMIV